MLKYNNRYILTFTLSLMQQSPLEKKPILQVYWNISKEFYHESNSIDENQFQKVLNELQTSVSSGLMEDPILGEGNFFSTLIVIKLVINLLTKINSTLFQNKQSVLSSDGTKR